MPAAAAWCAGIWVGTDVDQRVSRWALEGAGLENRVGGVCRRLI